VQIETGSIQEAETLENSIPDKLGDKIETHVQRPRKPRLKKNKTPEENSADSIEDTIKAQNPEICIQFSAQTRKKLIDIKVNIGWINCSIEDYLVANRCFRCSRLIHRMRDCRGTEKCPLCADNHNLMECKALPKEYKCINCRSYNHHSRNTKINENHS